MIDAVLCELEGVVVETVLPRRRAMRQALAEEGLDASGIDELSRLPVRDAVARALAAHPASRDAILVDLIAAKATRHFVAEVATGVTLAPGAIEALAAIQARTRLALVTRAEREVADRIVAMAGLDGLFETIVSADAVVDPKPHPEGYRAALARLTSRRRVAGALALEDGVAGVRAARAAGVPCIVVGPLPAHEALEAHAIVDGLRGQDVDSLERLVAGGGARVG